MLQHLDATLIVRVFLGATFLLSGLIKLSDRRAFLLDVLGYGVLPVSASRLYARVIPWLEAVAGSLVLVGIGQRLGTSVLLLLLASFAVAVGANVLRGRRFPCRCFGSWTTEKIGIVTLVRIAVLIGLAAYIIQTSSSTVHTASESTDDLGAILVGVFLIIVAYLGANLSVLLAVLFPAIHGTSSQAMIQEERRTTNPNAAIVRSLVK